MNYNLDPESSVPLHVQAEDFLREMIQEDGYKNGRLLPNEVELSSQLKISRNTLRQAINRLVFEGLLIRKKGYGTVVAPQGVMGNARNWKSFSQEMQAMGIQVHNFELHVSHKIAPEEACRFFRRPSSSSMLCLERLRGKVSFPFVYFVSFFSPDIPLTLEEDFSIPLYEMKEKKYGVQVKTSREMISAKAAQGWLAQKLGIKEGEPILERKRFVLDKNGVPVEYNIGFYRSDSFTYSIEFTNG